MPSSGTGSAKATSPFCEATFAEKRAFLASGAPWPDEPRPDCIETHASLVFLTRNRAWKMKKPVKLVHVDQLSLDVRERLCREEVRLNRELSGEVYRGLTPLVQRSDGSLSLGGEGNVVDWLVETTRLPAAAMLDKRLASGPPPATAEIGAVCDTLVGFYKQRKPSPDGGRIFHRRLMRDCRVARQHLREMAPGIGIPLSELPFDAAEDLLHACRDQIMDRGQRGLIFEGHGDLRAEHVCLTEPPVLFDRLEIDHGLRIVDPFFEVNALGLECSIERAVWVRAQLLTGLAGAFAPPSRRLLTAYGLVACLSRARIAADHFRDNVVADPEKYLSRTLAYLKAAADLVDPSATVRNGRC